MVDKNIENLKLKMGNGNKTNLMMKGYQIIDEDDDQIVLSKTSRRNWLWAVIIIGIPITAAIISIPAFIAWLAWKKTDVKIIEK